MVRSWAELYGGYGQDPRAVLKEFEVAGCDEMVICRGIRVYSTCEHHVLPFFGQATVGYIPNGGKVAGASKLARVVDIFARRLQVQERLTNEVADTLWEALKPLGVGVHIKAQHLCMTSRGVRRDEATMVTTALRGAILEKPEARAEFLAECRR